jgi:hypothetical protein
LKWPIVKAGRVVCRRVSTAVTEDGIKVVGQTILSISADSPVKTTEWSSDKYCSGETRARFISFSNLESIYEKLLKIQKISKVFSRIHS